METDDEYFDSTEFGDLLSAYEESVESGSPLFMDVDELVDIADYYDMTGHHDKAAQAIESALELDPGATLPLVFKAREAINDGDIAKANEYADEIDDKEDPDYIYLRAEILVAQDKLDQAEDYLHAYCDCVLPDEHDDVVLDVANMYLDYGIYDLAYNWLQDCKGKHQRDYKEMMARAAVGMEKYDEAISLCEQLIDERPFSKKHWQALGNAQYLNGNYHEAITSCEYALAIDPNYSNSLITKANCLIKLGNLDGARDFYGRYIKAMPHDAYGEMSLGNCLLTMSRFEEAITHLRKAAKLDSAYDHYKQQIYESMAICYSALGKPDKALASMDKAADPLLSNFDKGMQLVMRGHILLENRQSKEAEAMYRKAIVLSGNAPEVVLRVIVSLFDNGYTTVAYDMFKLFFEVVDDDFDEGYSYMALCCWELKKHEEFAFYLKEACKRNLPEARTVLLPIVPQGSDIEQFLDDLLSKMDNDQG